MSYTDPRDCCGKPRARCTCRIDKKKIKNSNTITMNKKGLYGKYKIEKADGSKIDNRAMYFVLRHDPFGDHCHVQASRKALKVYADEIEDHIPELAKDIRRMLSNYDQTQQHNE